MSDDVPREPSPERVLVLLDASPGSLAALHAAVLLARHLGRPLDALFIQDVNLLHLAGLPFCREVGSYTASVRLLEQDTIQREFRLVEQQMRGLVQQVIEAAEIEGAFRSVRDSVRQAALREAAAASFVGLGRVGRLRAPARRIGSTLETLLRQTTTPLLVGGRAPSDFAPPLIVLFTGSEASHRALALAIDLADRTRPPLSILVAAEMVRARAAEHTLQVLLAGRTIPYSVVSQPDPARLREQVRRSPSGTLILPGDAVAFLNDFDRTLFLVP